MKIWKNFKPSQNRRIGKIHFIEYNCPTNGHMHSKSFDKGLLPYLLQNSIRASCQMNQSKYEDWQWSQQDQKKGPKLLTTAWLN